MFLQFLLPLATLFFVKGDDKTTLSIEKLMTSVSAPQKTADKTMHGESSKKIVASSMSANSHFEQIGWPRNRCRKLGSEFTACSRKSAHEEVFCIRTAKMCDGTNDCPYADDEDSTRCLFHRLSMDEMSRIRLAFNHLTEKGMPRRQAILWTDEEGKARDQNGDFVA